MSSGASRTRAINRRAAGRTANRAVKASTPAAEGDEAEVEITEADIDAGVQALAVVADSGKLDPAVQDRVAALGGKFLEQKDALEAHAREI